MTTNKRRRAIDIPESLYQLVKRKASERGVKTPTGLVSKILIGEEAPIEGQVDIYEKSKHSVSMTEALWLSIKVRQDNQKVASITSCSCDILLGTSQPLSEAELSEGLKWAQTREDRRAMKISEPPKKKAQKAKKRAKAKAKKPESVEPEKEIVIESEYTETDDVFEDDKREDSKPIFQPAVENKMVDRPAVTEQDEFYGGVKLF